MKVLTIPQAVKEIRALDPATAINETMLTSLIEKKKLPCGSRGVRTVVNLELTISVLNELLGFVGEVFLPRIRTIRAAASELRDNDDESGMGEDHIRRCVADEKIGVIAIGNRNYIAMQSFDAPYSEKLVYGTSQSRTQRDMIRKDMLAQMSTTISTKSSVPSVVRVRREK